MATNIYMPALGMAQTTGRLIQWLKAPGDSVTEGEPLMEIETDKATVEIEAPATGILAQVTAQPEDDVPVGQVVAQILTPEEVKLTNLQGSISEAPCAPQHLIGKPTTASPVAARMATELNIDLNKVNSTGGRIQKRDIEAYIAGQAVAFEPVDAMPPARLLASPKARRLSRELKVNLTSVVGTGPHGAVLAADVQAAAQPSNTTEAQEPARAAEPLNQLWRVMVERLSQAWATTPQFQIMREVDSSRLVDWRARAGTELGGKLTYTDLLVKLTAAALKQHPRLNATWNKGDIGYNPDINIGLAVAIQAGLVVPVIKAADTLRLGEIAARREELMDRAAHGRLSLDDLTGGTFTISNLGMYGVDAFNALINPPQAAILAVGRIAERVVAVRGQPAVRPTMIISLTCDHRVVDGARAAEFLATLAGLIEEPLGLLT